MPASQFAGQFTGKSWDAVKTCCLTTIMLAFMMIYSNPEGLALNDSATADLAWSKQYVSSGTMPLVNEYVRYYVTITNRAGLPIENQVLWVSFVSAGSKTQVYTTFAIPTLEAGSSTTLNLGPFKMREAGEHYLFMGIKGDGNPALPNEIMLNYERSDPVDKFMVYEPTESQVIPIAVSIAASGAAVTALHFSKKRKINAK